jgi:hypothetical protein
MVEPRRGWDRSGAIRLFIACLFLFVAWLVAANGWVKAFAVLWLVYPTWFVARRLSRR